MFFQVIDNCIPASFCQDLIAFSEEIGFKKSLFNGKLNTEVRNSFSARVDLKQNMDLKTLQDFHNHLASFCPKNYNGKNFVKVTTDNLNILKYGEGNYFKPHTDGTWVEECGRSLITVQIYLNDVEEGGETNFFNSEGKVVAAVKPKCGTVAFFDHLIMHEGAPVQKGHKYTFRINAVYEN